MINKIKTLLSSFFTTTEKEVYIEPTPEEHCLMLLINKMIDDKCFEKSITKNNFASFSPAEKGNIDFHRFLNHLKNIAVISDYPSDDKKSGKFNLVFSNMEYHIMVNINDDDSAFKIQIKEIGEYVGLESNLKDCKPLKRSEVTVTFPVRPEYIAKNATDPKKLSIVIFFIVLIGGIATFITFPDVYIDLIGFLVLMIIMPAFAFGILLYHNFKLKGISFGINENFIIRYGDIISKIKTSKLEKIELIRNSRNNQLLMIKFYQVNFRLHGAIFLNNEMFDLESILRQLKSLDTIPQDIWIEKITESRRS